MYGPSGFLELARVIFCWAGLGRAQFLLGWVGLG